MKLFVLGAGGQGGPCVSILARDPDITEVILADIDLQAAQKVRDKVNHPKVRILQVDGSQVEQIVTAAAGCHALIDLSPPWLAPTAMQAALQLGAHYVNTAFDQPFWDQLVAGQPLSLDEAFREAGLTALLGCGMAPGFINVLARHYADQLDEIDTIKLRLGKKKHSPDPYADITAPWNPGWSPKQALIDCAAKPYVYRDQAYEQLGPYSEIEEWPFPDPVGPLLVSHHSHEEVYTLPKTIGKGLRYCDFKYYVSHQPATLVSMGLASQEEISVNGATVKPIDVVMALVPKPGNAFLEETREAVEKRDREFFTSMMIEMTGRKDGAARTFTIHCPSMNAPGGQLMDLFGTSLINVALPAVIGAKMIANGPYSGITFAEELDADTFLRLYEESGAGRPWVELS